MLDRLIGRMGPRCRTAATALAVLVGLTATPAALSQTPPPILVDGQIEDWVENEFVLIDDEHLYIRGRMAAVTNTRAERFTVLIDTDADEQTGLKQGGLGVDLSIAFGAPREGRRRRRGPQVTAHTSGGERELTAQDLDLQVAPTHASAWFELRLDRVSEALREALPAAGLLSRGRVAVQIVGSRVRTPGDAAIEVRAGTAAEPAGLSEARVPAKPRRALRVLSWNVLWGRPQADAEPFGRILAALKPDVILFQEWDQGEASESDVARWLNRHAGWGEDVPGASDDGWSVMNSSAWGVAIATPYEITERAGAGLRVDGTRWDFPVRVAAAVIETPIGEVLAASVHYKASGGLGTDEDLRRLAEAHGVNDLIEGVIDEEEPELVIFGGDYNLNGTAGVQLVSAAGLDTDGSALTFATPQVLGDTALYTFHGRRGNTGVYPRLDFISYSDASAEVVNAFVLDTERLSEASLRAAGLAPGDTWASDHLPVVVDLERK